MALRANASGRDPYHAGAIVKYRESHGDFRVWGDLLVIYGVDGRKIEAAKDRMTFSEDAEVMSQPVPTVPPAIRRAVRLYEAPIGKKAVMAVTGLILFGYVLGHLLGNLQVYSPDPEQIKRYAAFLHDPSHAPLLWGVRVLLLVAVAFHVIASV